MKKDSEKPGALNIIIKIPANTEYHELPESASFLNSDSGRITSA
jgi:hypothetical protein